MQTTHVQSPLHCVVAKGPLCSVFAPQRRCALPDMQASANAGGIDPSASNERDYSLCDPRLSGASSCCLVAPWRHDPTNRASEGDALASLPDRIPGSKWHAGYQVLISTIFPRLWVLALNS